MSERIGIMWQYRILQIVKLWLAIGLVYVFGMFMWEHMFLRRINNKIRYSHDAMEIASIEDHNTYNERTDLMAENKSVVIDQIDSVLIGNTNWTSHPTLQRVLTKEEHDELVELLDTLAQLFMNENITFIMADGTLLGSYMVHDILPWDDDLDIMVDFDDHIKVLQLFVNETLRKKYEVSSFQSKWDLYDIASINITLANFDQRYDIYKKWGLKNPDFKFKYFKTSSKPAGIYPWKWPYVDVKYFTNHGSKIKKIDNKDPQKYRFSSHDFFPLHMRPFSLHLAASTKRHKSFPKEKI